MPALPPLPDGLTVNRADLRLERGEFHAGPVPKSLVVVHGTGDGSARAAVRRWNEAPAKIGAALVVDRDGAVYETFDPDGWAVHVGTRGGALGGTEPGGVERRSVAVELANWGALARAGGRDGGGFVSHTGQPVPASRVVELEERWRGVRYAERYPEAQVAAACAVVAALAARYGLREVAEGPLSAEADPSRWASFEGVVAHSHLSRRATDVHPGFPWERLQEAVREVVRGAGRNGAQT